MKNLKKIINILSSFFNYLRLLDYKPYKLKSILFPYQNYSDFFIYDSECFQNIYITENLYGLLTGKEIEVNHFFRFYNNEGNLVREFSKKSNQLIETILLPVIKTECKYLSFTHEIKIQKGLIDNKLRKIILNSRGYTKYKYRKDSIGTITHGNFGAISGIKIGAIQRRNKFCYTPVFRFQEKDTYHLVFNNPTSKKLKIEITSWSRNNIIKLRETLLINKFGSDYFELKNYDSNISFISNLPICRCLIFKNPFRKSYNNDVFHS